MNFKNGDILTRRDGRRFVFEGGPGNPVLAEENGVSGWEVFHDGFLISLYGDAAGPAQPAPSPYGGTRHPGMWHLDDFTLANLECVFTLSPASPGGTLEEFAAAFAASQPAPQGWTLDGQGYLTVACDGVGPELAARLGCLPVSTTQRVW